MKHFNPATLAATLIAAAFLLPAPAMAHCDGVDGPVVTKAKQSLERGNVNLVLPWVRAEDEPAIRHAFEHASAVRKLGPEARQLADDYFYEWSGAPPPGRTPGPAARRTRRSRRSRRPRPGRGRSTPPGRRR